MSSRALGGTSTEGRARGWRERPPGVAADVLYSGSRLSARGVDYENPGFPALFAATVA